MAQATLSSKNQIVIPREARHALGVKVGDRLLVVVRGERVIVLEKPKRNTPRFAVWVRVFYPAGFLAKERKNWD